MGVPEVLLSVVIGIFNILAACNLHGRNAALGALVCVRVINSIPVSVVLVIARSQRRSDHKR